MKLIDEQEKGLRLLPGGITNKELAQIEEKAHNVRAKGNGLILQKLKIKQ